MDATRVNVGREWWGAAKGWLVMCLMFLLPMGEIYWFWMAFVYGSLKMAVLGLVLPLIVITAPLGAWSLFFGPPAWLLQWIGQA